MVDPVVSFLLPFVGLVGGVKWAHGKRYDVCSNPDCLSVLPAGAAECPNCGGKIVESLDVKD